MKRLTNSLLTTFALVSRIPLKCRIEPVYEYTVFFLPVMGIVVGALDLVGGFAAQVLFGDSFLVAVSIVVFQYGLFNIFHFDGLLDSADALLVFGERRKRLEILKDVKIGSFALFGGIVYMCTKLYVLFRGVAFLRTYPEPAMDGLAAAVLMFSHAVSGRAAAAFIPCLVAPARPDGLGALLGGSSFGHAAAGTILALLPVTVLWGASPRAVDVVGWVPLLSFLSIPAAGAVAGIAYKKKIGGYTGDALGLAVELGELIHLILFFLLMGV